ncbi:MAG: BT4734/BF3469 family protein [Bacteroidales bacterium]
MNVNNKISLFRNYRTPVPGGKISVFDFCAAIIKGEFQDQVAKIRNEKNKQERDQLKSLLPAGTISGLFSYRANDRLIKHSGFICLDFDSKGNPDVSDWPALRDTIGGYPEVYFCALSVSGRGCFAIIPLAYPERHKVHFQALKKDFASLGLVIDNCGDVARLRGVSSDPDATFNRDAQEYRRVYIPKPQPHQQQTSSSTTFEKLKKWVDSRNSFAHGNRNNYVMDFAGACHRLGVSQSNTERELLRYACQDFSEKEILRTIRSIYKKKWRV